MGSSYARVFPRRAIYTTEIIMEFLPFPPLLPGCTYYVVSFTDNEAYLTQLPWF
jgi:hypothetical protein